MLKDKAPTAKSLQKAFTRRYCVAMSLVFCVMMSTFLAFTRQTQIADNDAHLINMSGMQRSYSQRIALMASEIRRSKSAVVASDYADKLNRTIERMYESHEALTSGNLGGQVTYKLSPAVRDMYFGETALDQRVRDYLRAAKAYLKMYREDGLRVMKQAVRAEDNLAYARQGLLTDLNATVALYEAEAQSRIKSFQRLEVTFFTVGVLVLGLEVLFIFRPMVRAIALKTGALEAKNSELIDLSKKLVAGADGGR